MRKIMMVGGFAVMVCLLAAWPDSARAQGGLEPVTADAFTRAVPTDFYLEGEHIPVEKRNAAVLKNGKGARVVVALLDTSGYASQIKEKYTGMLITETRLSVCGHEIGVGSYGFGLERQPSAAEAPFRIYNQAGEKVGECTAKRDIGVKQPKPLAVNTAQGGAARLCLGRFVVEIR